MNKYINADELKEQMIKYGWKHPDSTVHEFVDDMPSADVRENKHGEWVDKGSLSCRCSNCGCKSSKESKFCPECGADMRGKTE